MPQHIRRDTDTPPPAATALPQPSLPNNSQAANVTPNDNPTERQRQVQAELRELANVTSGMEVMSLNDGERGRDGDALDRVTSGIEGMRLNDSGRGRNPDPLHTVRRPQPQVQAPRNGTNRPVRLSQNGRQLPTHSNDNRFFDSLFHGHSNDNRFFDSLFHGHSNDNHFFHPTNRRGGRNNQV